MATAAHWLAMTNRLADATSPYLLQHKDNPVDWWQWGAEAFAEARRRGVPVLLSVGYAACHWCHVMAHESFEDEATAALMNEHFVCVKVDREERPDVDAVYMEATQAMTGHGGWPMTCFLTPDGEPFFCGTYFPPATRPACRRSGGCCASVAQAWAERNGRGRGGRRRRRAAALRARRPPAGAARSTPGCSTRRRRGSAPTTTTHAAASAARRSSRRRWCWSSCCASTPAPATSAALRGRRADLRGDGPRRDLRPAGRRLRPLLRRRRLGGAALREDALRQRAAAARLRALVARDRLATRPGGSPWRPPTGCCASCARRRAGSPPRSTPTARARRGRTYVWTPQHGGPGRGRRAGGDRSPSPPRARSSTAARCCSCWPTRPTPSEYAAVRARLLACAGSAPRRRATTRWSPRGTGWRSPRWPTAARCFDRPTCVDAAERCADLLLATCMSSTARLRRVSRDGRGRRTARRAGGLRRRGRGAARAAPGDRRPALAGRSPGELLDAVLDALRRRRRRLLRHRRRRRAAGAPAAGPDRQRHAVRRWPPLPGALLTYAALTGDPATGRPPRRRSRPSRRWSAGTPRFAGWAAAVGRGAASPGRSRWRWSARPGLARRRPAGDLARGGRRHRRAGSPLLADRPARRGVRLPGLRLRRPGTDAARRSRSRRGRSPGPAERPRTPRRTTVAGASRRCCTAL